MERRSAPGTAISLDIVVEYWSAGGRTPWRGPALRPRQLIAAGHTIQDAAFTPTYLTCGGPAATLNVPPALMYEAWHPNLFVDGSTLPAAERGRNRGALVHLWCDDPTIRSDDELPRRCAHDFG